jgi:hypothetical protein
VLPQPDLAPQPHVFLRSPRGLATATSVLLGVVAVIDLFALYAGTVMHAVAGDLLSRSSDEIDRADALYEVAGNLQLLGTVATAVVFIVWFHRVRTNADVFAQDVCTRSPGWAIGAWFIPVGNLWLPFGIARDIWTASAQTSPDGSWRKVSHAPIRAWWTAWVAALLVNRFGSTMEKNATTPDALQRAADVVMLADALNLAAAALAILFVRKLTAMQDLKATHGPVAAV